MKALTLVATGAPEEMTISDIELPQPAAGQIRIAVTACGLNPSDFQRARYGVPEWIWPAVLGLDPVGTVHAVGEGVEDFAVGDRVVAHHDIRARGGFADYTVVAAAATAHVPDVVGDAYAAAVPAAGLTAYDAIVRKLNVSVTDLVLITGAAGGVGGFALQLAKNAGATVIASDAGSNRERVLALGADYFIDFQTQDVVETARAIAGPAGVNAVLDTVGTRSATGNATLLGFGGRIATTAGRPDLSAIPPFTIGPSAHEIALGAAYTHGTDADRRRLGTMLTDLMRMVAGGSIDPMLVHQLSLEQVPQALGALSRHELTGKAVFVARSS